MPDSQHAHSNASQMPLECAGCDRSVFLQTRSLLRCLILMSAAHACLLDHNPHFESSDSPELVLLAHPALLDELLPALPVAVKPPAAGAPAQSSRRQRASGRAGGGPRLGSRQCMVVRTCFLYHVPAKHSQLMVCTVQSAGSRHAALPETMHACNSSTLRFCRTFHVESGHNLILLTQALSAGKPRMRRSLPGQER